MKKHYKITLALIATAAVVAGCATHGSTSSPAELDKMTAAIVKSTFSDKGIVKTSVLDTDETLKACSAADVAGKPLDDKTAKALEAVNFKTIKWPANDKYLGDWKAGEKLAQNGRGLTCTDKADTPNGANCYNCHQISKQEISFGTIGPSLYNYRKTHGVPDPNGPVPKDILMYTWGKIWNAKAYNACSNMPRAGHMGILTEAQVADVVALLLDPKSPANQ